MNNRRALRLGAVALFMFGFGFALVPLYGFVCRVAGLQSAGYVARAEAAMLVPSARTVTVRFDANVDRHLPWVFEPLQRTMTVHLGQMQEVRYRVHNLTGHAVTAQAVPTVLPFQAAEYFTKAECFCFTQQTLKGDEEREMPVRFVVSPNLPEDVDSLTVSYAFLGLPDQGRSKP